MRADVTGTFDVSTVNVTPRAATNHVESFPTWSVPSCRGDRSRGRMMVLAESDPIVVSPGLSHQSPSNVRQPVGP